MGADGPIALDVFGGHALGLGHGVVGSACTLDAPRQVDRRWPGGDESPSGIGDVVVEHRCQSHAHGPGRAQRRRASDRHRADGLAEIVDGRAVEERQCLGETALVDQPDVVTAPLDGGRNPSGAVSSDSGRA